MIGWFVIAAPMAVYGAFVIIGLAGGNRWMIEGLVCWFIAAAVLVADLLTRYSRSAEAHNHRL
jgi:hypothetical protein